MKVTTTLELSAKELDDIDYALAILRINQNTHDDKECDAQSVRAYKLMDKIFKQLGATE